MFLLCFYMTLTFRGKKEILVIHCCYSVSKSCLTLGDPMNCSMPGFPVLYYLLEFAQTHVHCVNFSLVAQLYPTLCDPMDCACQASLSIINSQSLLRLMSIETVMPSKHLILCHPLLLLPSIFLLLLPSVFPSIRGFSNESALHIMWPQYWSVSFNISPSNEYSGLISFRMDWFDLLAVQRTLKSLLQHHSSKASILWCSAFLIIQSSHPYMTTGNVCIS